MVLIQVFVKVKESTVNEFEVTLKEVVAEACQMTGCIRYEWYRSSDSSLQYAIFGEFETKEFFDNYLNSVVVKRVGDELIPLLDGLPSYKHYEASIFDSN